MTAQLRYYAARELDADHRAIMFDGISPNHQCMLWGSDGWTSTPFQNSTADALTIAHWLWSQGGCPAEVVDMGSDGSATIYVVECDDDGEPINVEIGEDVDAPEFDIDVVRTGSGEYCVTAFWPNNEPYLSWTDEGLHPGIDGERLAALTSTSEDVEEMLEKCFSDEEYNGWNDEE